MGEPVASAVLSWHDFPMRFTARSTPLHPAHSRRTLLALGLAAALSACGGGGGGGGGSDPGGQTPPPDEPVGEVVQSVVQSTHTRTSYPVSVYLPESYRSGTRRYPVIYAVEGDARFGYGAGQGDTRFDAFKAVMQRRGTQAILVGIGGTARRDIDFLVPGANRYHAFIVEELIPRLEAQYRVDPGRRALSGLSHGGHFVNMALFIEGAAGEFTFTHFLSTETSTGNVGLETFLAREEALHGTNRPLRTTVFLAAGAAGASNQPQVSTLYQLMLAHDHEGLTLLYASYPTSHAGADIPAFEAALERFFP